MGRAPCCDKASVKKGPWSPEEDEKLKSYIEKNGTGGNWIALPQKIGLKRCGKSCRLRWLNYLRPNIKHGGFSEEEDNIICSLYISIGSRWSIIAAQLPGRTDNDIKNYWNTRLKKKLLGKQRKDHQARRGGINNGYKQEMATKKGHGNPMMVSSANLNINNQNLELPLLAPIPYANQEQRFNDHTSIRKLLIKLGGKFSNDNDQMVQTFMNSQFPNDHHMSFNQQIYDHQAINMSSSASTSMEAMNTNASAQFALSQYSNNIDWSSGSQILLGQSNFQEENMAFNNSNTQRLDGLEFLLGDNMLNDRVGSLSDMSSLVYQPVDASNCEGTEEKLQLQECDSLDELKYRP